MESIIEFCEVIPDRIPGWALFDYDKDSIEDVDNKGNKPTVQEFEIFCEQEFERVRTLFEQKS
jgi:hypothetical protein